MKKCAFYLLLSVLFITSCDSTVEDPVGWATPLQMENQADVFFLETKAAESEVEGNEAEFTEEMRLPPENWQQWPVVPEVTAAAREIYRQGADVGNDPHAFSKVADCQNLKEYFLKKFDYLELYQSDFKIDDYLDTIENFQGYFNRDGYSTKFGFTAASPLTQFEADPEYCLPGETPLECELRITRPIFVLVSMEFPFLNRSAENYERYMRQIIEYIISQGAVPILATKADNTEGDHSINLTIAKLAYEYDIPLWNWWAAAQPLPDHGMDVYRGDFHISQLAWEERSRTFLMTLDHLWKGLKDLN
jgi:hypothetical protein